MDGKGDGVVVDNTSLCKMGIKKYQKELMEITLLNLDLSSLKNILNMKYFYWDSIKYNMPGPGLNRQINGKLQDPQFQWKILAV